MRAILGALALVFLRDRGGLVLAFALPPLMFVIFAALFGASTRGELDLSIAAVDATGTAQGAALMAGLEARQGERLVRLADTAAVDERVLAGRADIGIVIRGPLGGAAPAVELVVNPGRPVAATMAQGLVQEVASGLGGGGGPPQPALTVARSVGSGIDTEATYYAGAVSILFLLFNAIHVAMAGLEERRAGLTHRLALLAGGVAPLLAGRLLWLTLLGTIQAATIFATAGLLFDVPVLPVGPLLLATAILAAAAAAATGMALVGICRTRDQAQPFATSTALVLGALGGSMVPRFLMPEAFQRLSWFTPHAWVIEAYQAIFWRGSATPLVWTAWGVLAAIAATAFTLAAIAERRRLTAS
ncbi:ABC transporter permease [Zavarzinia sp. CC-PAN008]|uniref:ABC transporter permease n=1 Tax=Zavarzinia sp. CC-PAN008 TaxID=3243332 RepID=UPI003F74237A